MLRNCTIFLRNRRSAPQKEVDVRLAAHPFSPRAPFLAVRHPICADPIRRRPQERMGSVFAAGEKKLRAFLMIVSTILRWISLWLSFSRELSSNVWRFSVRGWNKASKARKNGGNGGFNDSNGSLIYDLMTKNAWISNRDNNACAIHGNPWPTVPNILSEAAVIFDDALARRK